MNARTTNVFGFVLVATAAAGCGGGPPAASPHPDAPASTPDAKPSPSGVKPSVPPPPPANPVASEPMAPTEKPVAPEPATPPTDKRLVGHWTYSSGSEPRFAFNTKGRVHMALGGTKCVGNYLVKGDKLDVKYDAGQRGCSEFGPPASFSLKDKDATLAFAGASYKRDDAKDDAGF